MIPDITIKNYYLNFIYTANADISKYKEVIDIITKIKEELYNYIDNHKNILLNIYNIDVTNFDKEWNNKTYNSSEHLYNKVIKLLQYITEDSNKIVLLQTIKYCNILRKEYKYNSLLNIANKRKSIKFGTYRKYVANYYNKVHKCVLEGLGYKFSYGIGTYVINCWKLQLNNVKNPKMLDFNATNIRKRELLAQGKKIYDDKEAAWYKARNIPYDGIDYRIYKDKGTYYEFTFINSALFRNKSLDYQRTEYVAAKYRGMSYKEMADKLCNTLNDIYTLQVDIKYKLNILLYKFPNKYLNYIRNVEQYKYKYRTYHCQNR